MISLTKINGEEFFLNDDLIETVSNTHDTVITLTNGNKLIVTESGEDIIEKVIAFRSSVFQNIRFIDNDK
ncbi:MAG: flagellar FlbD family protein [FCB group bacterium]|nr:flagellar FlbD family protein [FCB group bacterium]